MTKKKNLLQTKIEMEEGSNILDFEKDVNKALLKLSEKREIERISFKTGIKEDVNHKEYSWYSIVLHHKPRETFEMRGILDRIDAIDEAISDLPKMNQKVNFMEKKLNALIEKEQENDNNK